MEWPDSSSFSDKLNSLKHSDNFNGTRIAWPLLQQLLQHGPLAMVLLKGEGFLVEMANPMAENFLGTQLQIGLPFLSQIPPMLSEQIAKTVKQAWGVESSYGNMPLDQVYHSIKLQLEDQPLVLLTWTPQTVNSLGQLEQLVEKRTADIRKAYSFVNAVIENIPDMIFVKEAKQLRFVRFNRAGEILLGFKREDLIGKNDYDFFPKTEADFFVSKDREVLRNGKMMEIQEETIQTNYGTRYLHTKKIPLYSEDGTEEYLVGISQDITEKKLAQESRDKLLQEQIARQEAEKALKLRDEFLSVVGHELRTPLSALMLIVQLLERKLSEVSDDTSQLAMLGGFVKKSRQNLDEFSRLVEDLLDVSRLSTGRLSIEKMDIDLNEIIQKCVNRYEEMLNESGCALRMELQPGIVGHWDPMRIEQVITNLLTNAMKYGEGRPIVLTTFRKEKMVVIKMQDFGIGIAEESLPKIFKRFERAVSSRDYCGFGLGLYITEQLVLAHGGRVCVESQLGQGSTFIVELPIIQ